MEGKYRKYVEILLEDENENKDEDILNTIKSKLDSLNLKEKGDILNTDISSVIDDDIEKKIKDILDKKDGDNKITFNDLLTVTDKLNAIDNSQKSNVREELLEPLLDNIKNGNSDAAAKFIYGSCMNIINSNTDSLMDKHRKMNSFAANTFENEYGKFSEEISKELSFIETIVKNKEEKIKGWINSIEDLNDSSGDGDTSEIDNIIKEAVTKTIIGQKIPFVLLKNKQEQEVFILDEKSDWNVIEDEKIIKTITKKDPRYKTLNDKFNKINNDACLNIRKEIKTSINTYTPWGDLEEKRTHYLEVKNNVNKSVEYIIKKYIKTNIFKLHSEVKNNINKSAGEGYQDSSTVNFIKGNFKMFADPKQGLKTADDFRNLNSFLVDIAETRNNSEYINKALQVTSKTYDSSDQVGQQKKNLEKFIISNLKKIKEPGSTDSIIDILLDDDGKIIKDLLSMAVGEKEGKDTISITLINNNRKIDKESEKVKVKCFPSIIKDIYQKKYDNKIDIEDIKRQLSAGNSSSNSDPGSNPDPNVEEIFNIIVDDKGHVVDYDENNKVQTIRTAKISLNRTTKSIDTLINSYDGNIIISKKYSFTSPDAQKLELVKNEKSEKFFGVVGGYGWYLWLVPDKFSGENRSFTLYDKKCITGGKLIEGGQKVDTKKFYKDKKAPWIMYDYDFSLLLKNIIGKNKANIYQGADPRAKSIVTEEILEEGILDPNFDKIIRKINLVYDKIPDTDIRYKDLKKDLKLAINKLSRFKKLYNSNNPNIDKTKIKKEYKELKKEYGKKIKNYYERFKNTSNNKQILPTLLVAISLFFNTPIAANNNFKFTEKTGNAVEHQMKRPSQELIKKQVNMQVSPETINCIETMLNRCKIVIKDLEDKEKLKHRDPKIVNRALKETEAAKANYIDILNNLSPKSTQKSIKTFDDVRNLDRKTLKTEANNIRNRK